jgi:threonine dehydrogenase-like Zn-dependent dehydrogenase
VPFADVGPIKVPNGLTDDQVLFLYDILPTGWMGADMANIKPGDVVAVWGCGPVGQFAIASAYLMGAERVYAIDRFPYRLQMAREKCGAITINYEEVESVVETLTELTGGRGPDACIDAVGLESHSHGIEHALDRTKQALKMTTDRIAAVRQAIMSCKNGGTVSIIGVYGGFVDKFPLGSVMNRSLTIRAGQCHVQKYMPMLLEKIQNGDIDPSFVISHHLPLADAAKGYEMFVNKVDNCEKVVLKV